MESARYSAVHTETMPAEPSPSPLNGVPVYRGWCGRDAWMWEYRARLEPSLTFLEGFPAS